MSNLYLFIFKLLVRGRNSWAGARGPACTKVFEPSSGWAAPDVPAASSRYRTATVAVPFNLFACTATGAVPFSTFRRYPLDIALQLWQYPAVPNRSSPRNQTRRSDSATEPPISPDSDATSIFYSQCRRENWSNMIVTVKKEVTEPVVRLARSPEWGLEGALLAAQETRQKSTFFKARNLGIYQHASASSPSSCSPAWELEFISTIAHRTFNFEHAPTLSPSIRCTRAVQDSLRRNHRSRARTGPFRLQEELSNGDGSPVRFYIYYWRIDPFTFKSARRTGAQTVIGSLGQLWNALASAPGAKNELLNGGLSSILFFFPSFVYQVKTWSQQDHYTWLQLASVKQQYSTAWLQLTIQYAYRIFADPFINHTNYCSLSPPVFGSASSPLLPEIHALRQAAN